MNYADRALELGRLHEIRSLLESYEQALQAGAADQARDCINRVETLAGTAWFSLLDASLDPGLNAQP